MGPYGHRMATFQDLETNAPEIAAFIRGRIDATGLCLVGTTRRDGWPRVSAWELFLLNDLVYVGSMPNAVKVRDLRRDPRCCLFTPVADKDDLAGEGKLFCQAREINTENEHEEVRRGFEALRGFDMGEFGGGHVLEMAIHGAAWQRLVGDEWRTTSWREGGAVRERSRTGPLGESVDLW